MHLSPLITLKRNKDSDLSYSYSPHILQSLICKPCFFSYVLAPLAVTFRLSP